MRSFSDVLHSEALQARHENDVSTGILARQAGLFVACPFSPLRCDHGEGKYHTHPQKKREQQKYASSHFEKKGSNKNVGENPGIILGSSAGFLKWWYPQIIHFNRVLHYKPSILGYPYFWKTPIWKLLLGHFFALKGRHFRGWFLITTAESAERRAYLGPPRCGR